MILCCDEVRRRPSNWLTKMAWVNFRFSFFPFIYYLFLKQKHIFMAVADAAVADCICNLCEAFRRRLAHQFHFGRGNNLWQRQVNSKKVAEKEKSGWRMSSFQFLLHISFLWFIYSHLNGVSEALVYNGPSMLFSSDMGEREKNYTISATFRSFTLWVRFCFFGRIRKPCASRIVAGFDHQIHFYCFRMDANRVVAEFFDLIVDH